MSASRIFQRTDGKKLHKEKLIPEPIMLTCMVLLEISVFPPSLNCLG